MFGGLYFAQAVFAGAILTVVPTPPAPPVPPAPGPEVVVHCEKFAVGPCVGTEDAITKVPVVGRQSCVPTARTIGFSSNRNPCPSGGIGTKGG